MKNPDITELLNFNLSCIGELQNINDKLFTYYSLSLLTYRKIYPTNKMLHLSCNKEWLTKSAENEYWFSRTSTQRIHEALEKNKRVTHVWETEPQKTDEIYQSMYETNCWNGITIYECIGDAVGLWAFSSTRDRPHVNSIYINNLDVLFRFIHYFKYKAHEILTKVESDLLLPSPIYLQNSDRLTSITNKSELFKTPKFIVETDKSRTIISSQEKLCMQLLTMGKKVKSIAGVLNISPRTVQAHLNSAKIKTNCYSLEDLIIVYRENFYDYW